MAPLTFEEILQYHPQNEQILKRLKMQLPHLIPFVGAGLSAFAYPQWAEALKEMARWDRHSMPEAGPAAGEAGAAGRGPKAGGAFG